MAGLVPAIHVLRPCELDKFLIMTAALLQDVDGRDKPGHDEF
jgi:hypothetical protein